MAYRSVPRIALNLEEAVASTGLGRNTLLGAIERGELPCRRLGPKGPGRRLVILCSSLETWLTPNPPQDNPSAPIAPPEPTRLEPN